MYKLSFLILQKKKRFYKSPQIEDIKIEFYYYPDITQKWNEVFQPDLEIMLVSI